MSARRVRAASRPLPSQFGRSSVGFPGTPFARAQRVQRPMTQTPASEERAAGKSFRAGARTNATQATRDVIDPDPKTPRAP